MPKSCGLKKKSGFLQKLVFALQVTEKDMIKDESEFGIKPTKNQNLIDGKTKLKKNCWKLKFDQLGHISNLISFKARVT